MSNREKFTVDEARAPFWVKETQKQQPTGMGLERAREGKRNDAKDKQNYFRIFAQLLAHTSDENVEAPFSRVIGNTLRRAYIADTGSQQVQFEPFISRKAYRYSEGLF